MKAITITQLIKDLNPQLFTGSVGSIKQFSTLPKSLFSPTYNQGQRTDGYHTLDNSIHEADGFYDVISPSYNTATQKLGAIYFDVDKFTYPVIDKTDEEIQNEKIAESEANKQVLIQQQVEKQVIEQAQVSDDTTALDNKDLFPLWEVGFAYTVDFKCQDFDANNDLVLYKCVQAHTSQSDWHPKDVPALFTKVSYPNEIPVWVQPTGAQDAYNIGDQVHYPTISDPIYESLINANVWSPVDYPEGWQLI